MLQVGYPGWWSGFLQLLSEGVFSFRFSPGGLGSKVSTPGGMDSKIEGAVLENFCDFSEKLFRKNEIKSENLSIMG